MHNLEVFATKVYSKKTPKGNNLAELPWDIYLKGLKKKDNENEGANVKTKQKSVFEKMPAKYGVFHQHVKCAHLQSLIFNEADNSVIEMRNSEHFR